MSEQKHLNELLRSGYRYAISLVGDKMAAEDLLHDAWLAVTNARGPQTRVYLYAAIRSRFLNLYKRSQLVTITSLDDGLDEVASQDEFIDYFDQKLLDQALASLGPYERESLYLHIVEGYTLNEVAQQTHQSRGTVSSLIHRAKAKLKIYLQSHPAAERAP